MAEEQKQSWWKSLPGLLTAASGFVAALSGLVAGLNQLGVFRREEPAPQVVREAPAAGDSTAQHSAAPVTGGSASSAGPAAAPAQPLAPSAGTPSKPPTAASPGAVSPSAPAPAAAPRPPSSADTIPAGSQRLPKGTTLELTLLSRTCAPPAGQRRFTARLAAPVKVDGATVLPARTTAVLHIRRAVSPAAPQVRLDSLVGPDLALAVPPSQVRLRRDVVSGTCLPADARITVTLSAATTVRRR